MLARAGDCIVGPVADSIGVQAVGCTLVPVVGCTLVQEEACMPAREAATDLRIHRYRTSLTIFGEWG